MCLIEPAGPKAIKAHPARLAAVQKAALLEDPQVMEHRRRPKGKEIPELDQAHVAVLQALEAPAPRGISERPERRTESVLQHGLSMSRRVRGSIPH